MAGPWWLAVALATVMIATAIYCAGRLTLSRLWRRPTEVDADALHVVMGVAMAGMLLPRLSPLPPAAWEATFGVAAAWFGSQAIRSPRRRASGSAWRCSHPVPHLVESAAMVYMLAALPGAGPGRAGQAMPMPGMGGERPGGGFVALAVVLALFMIGYVLWTADQFTAMARATAAAAPDALPVPAPGTVGAASPSAGKRREMRVLVGRFQAGPVRRGGMPALAPGLAGCYKIAMGITMGYMLIAML